MTDALVANAPRTVMQLLPALEAGGVEQSTLEIVEALVRLGQRALVVSSGGRLVPRVEALGGTHITLDIGAKRLRTLRTVAPLRRLMREYSVDIVHARSRLPAWIARMALRGLSAQTRPRFVTTVHGLNSPSRYSAVMASGERVICVSDTVRAHVLKHYPRTDPSVVRVIPRGIDPARFPRRAGVDHAQRARFAQQWPALAGEGPLLLLPGRGTRLKGHADALNLLAALRTGGLDGRLWMPGARQDGRDAYLAELEALAQRLGVGAAVAMTPPIADMAQAYAAGDLVLQFSRKPESFGRTVVEALAVGVPVLGWDHGGVGEVLARLQPDGRIPLGDLAALQQRALDWLATPPTAVTAIPYTLAAMQQATLDVYDELH